MPILYFIGGQAKADPEQLCAGPFAHAFEAGGAITRRECFSGPGGAKGMLVCAGDGHLEYAADRQTWVELAGVRGIWIGLDRAQPPTPQELARGEQIDGYAATLADGQSWLVPAARVFPTGSALPGRLQLGPNGKWVSEPMERFLTASRLADRIWSSIAGDGAADLIDEAELPVIACEILAVNYRIGPQEISMLGLLSTTNVKLVCQLFVDVPGYMREMESKLPKESGREGAKKKQTPAPVP